MTSDASHLVKQAKVDLIHADWKCTVKIARAYSSLCHISADVVVDEWCNLWNEALNYGTKGTRIAQNIFRLLCRPLLKDKICPHCSIKITESTYADHVTISHRVMVPQILECIKLAKLEDLFTSPVCKNLLI